ncbi:MAG: hypothetical protein AAGD05_05745, partial [Bacteroidota bacterium]
MYLKPTYANQNPRSTADFSVGLRLWFCLLWMLLGLSPNMAQTWERFFDFASHDFSKNILQTADGGILVTANTGNGDDVSDVLLLKLNRDGDLDWSNTYGGASYDEIERLIPTPDGGYLMAGYTFSLGDGGDVYLVKIDQAGNLQWELNYGGSDFDRARSLVATNDGNFVFVGWTRSPVGGDVSEPPFGGPAEFFDGWVAKVSPTGTLLWDRRFGGVEPDEIHDVVAGPDGGVVMIMNTSSPEVGANGFDILALALDANGQEIWSETYGGTEYEEAFTIDNTLDGGYVIGAITSSFGNGESDIYLIKADANGVEEWTQTYGGATGEFGGYVVALEEGGYILSGATRSFGSSFFDVYLIRTDEMGQALWTQHYGGGDNVDVATSVFHTDDNHFLIAGQRREDDGPTILSSDLYVLKTDPLGNTVTNTIEGQVLWDSDGDCMPDAGALALEDWLVVASGAKTYYATTDVDGNYEMEVDTGAYLVELVPPNDYWAACTPASLVDFTVLYDTVQSDFVVNTAIDCPYLETDVSTPYLDHCTPNRYRVRYCNRGTIIAEEAFVTLTLHPDFALLDAEIPLFDQSGQDFTFQIDDIPTGTCDSFWVEVELDCATTITGQTHEIIAQITPDAICSPIDPAWDESSIALEATCLNDSVRVVIRNKGGDDM